MIIMKFGGSSIKDAERIEYVVSLINGRIDRKPLVVFSAMGKTTDNLIAAGAHALAGKVDITEIREHHFNVCKDLEVSTDVVLPLLNELEELLNGISLLKELSDKSSDYLVSFGERLSVRVISEYMNSINIPANFYDGWDAGIITNNCHKEAEVSPESYTNIKNNFASLKEIYEFTPIITGFIAKDPNGSITTLGRGGSDLTASVLGAALGVDEIQVWKDVNGILTTDPRIVPEAKPVPSISFDEAAELAYFGAKVLHPLSIQPAMLQGIPVRVKNSYNPDHPGSVIQKQIEHSNGLIKAITCKRQITVVDLVSSRMLGQHGFLAEVFSIFDTAGISVDMLATSEVSLSLTLNNAQKLPEIIPQLESISSVNVQKEKAIISLVGDISRSSEILNNVFNVFVENEINVQMISQGASKVNIGFVVDNDQVEHCINRLHSHFFNFLEQAA